MPLKTHSGSVLLAGLCVLSVFASGCGSQAKPSPEQAQSKRPQIGESSSISEKVGEKRTAAVPPEVTDDRGTPAADEQAVKTPTAAKSSDTDRPRLAVKAPLPSDRAPVGAPVPATRREASVPRMADAPARDAPTAFPAPQARVEAREAVRAAAPRSAAPVEPDPGEPVTLPDAPMPTTGSGVPENAPWEATASDGATDYSVVTVFYGTDRKVVEVSDARRRGYAGWFYATAICAGVTICFAVAALAWGHSRRLRVLASCGVAGTVLLGAVTTLARLQSERVNPGNHIGYGNERGALQVGTCEVSIPRYHEVGEVERPSILRLDFKEDPRRHVVLLDVQQEAPEQLFASLKARVEGSASKGAFVFVHGYNVTFEDAARRTAQLAYDLKFDGAPIFFSWPSQGGLLQYAVDETNVAWAVPDLREFLTQVARQSGARSVHLIAHSMGNRALTSALVGLAHRLKGQAPLFHEVVLTAPDIDADVFKRDIAPVITRAAQRVTLYASSNDEALAMSKRLHGYARAGDSGADMVVVDGIDTIDVSNVDTSLLGHSYYGSNDTVLADLFYVLTEPRPAYARRWLEAVPVGPLTYWVFSRPARALREAAQPGAAVR